MIADGAVTV